MQRNNFNFHYILHAAQLLEERLFEQLKPLGVRPRQARMLVAIERLGVVSQAELAREFEITAASMSTMAGRLVQAGYIKRAPDQKELRSNTVQLTAKGQLLVQDILNAWHALDADMDDVLGAAAAAQISESARGLRDALGGKPPKHHRETEVSITPQKCGQDGAMQENLMQNTLVQKENPDDA